MHALLRLADLAPVELAEHVVLAAIAALAPEEVVRTVARRRARIVGAALDRAERGHRVAPEPARPCLAFVEEAMADATPSPGRPQHRLPEIEHAIDRDRMLPERM